MTFSHAEMEDVFEMAITDLQPSQLYISQVKLSQWHARLNFEVCEKILPVPVKLLDGLTVMTDGHTRTFAAYLAGCKTLPVFWDQDDLDWEAYRICVAWCREESIRSVADLRGRVVLESNYETLWYERCRVMQSALAARRQEPQACPGEAE
jgi:hypothetical protein